MPTETLRRDLRIGLRVLVKEKAFCALAVIVLALGICGVTTMFSVVNGVMLRGFSFPNADRLVERQLHRSDERRRSSASNGQISAMDFEELRPAAAVVRAAGRLPERLDRQRHGRRPARSATPAPTSTEDFLRDPRRRADRWAATSRPPTTSPAPRRSRSSATASGSATSAAPTDIVGKGVRINGKPATIIGVMPQGFAFPTNEELWIPLYSEFPLRPRNDPRGDQPGRARPARSRASRSTRRTPSSTTHREALRRGVSGHQQAVQHRPGPAADRDLHAAAAARHAADDAGVLRRRAADRLRQRDEHAVRARHAARARSWRSARRSAPRAAGWSGRC